MQTILKEAFISDLILQSPQAAWFSPSGDQLLFSSFDYSKVGTVTLPEFESSSLGTREHQKLCKTTIRYSKVGADAFSNKPDKIFITFEEEKKTFESKQQSNFLLGWKTNPNSDFHCFKP